MATFYASLGLIVGFVHSLSPAHWIPIVMVSRLNKWKRSMAVTGALIASLGHILISLTLGAGSAWLGWVISASLEESIHRYSGGFLVLFGLGLAFWAWNRHGTCDHHKHDHHGPTVPRTKSGRARPFVFLFLVGMQPCIAILPVFVEASIHGTGAVSGAIGGFIVGVVLALTGATYIGTIDRFKLDHPLFEHYGDVITGVAIALAGLVILILAGLEHSHGHIH